MPGGGAGVPEGAGGLTTDVAVSDTEALIAQLDPERKYAYARTREPIDFDDLVAGIRAGKFSIAPGMGLPVVRDVTTNWALVGSGKPITESAGPQQAALAEFRRRFVDDLPELYRELFAQAMGSGRDKWHYMDILFKYGLPRGGESTTMGDTIDALRKFMEAAQAQTEVREVKVYDAA